MSQTQHTVLGIDLGTTNSVVATMSGGQTKVLTDDAGHRLLPSVVGFPVEGGVLVGHEAKEYRLIEPQNVIYSIKRLIGRPYRSPEIQKAKERFPFQLVEGPGQSAQISVRNETFTLPEISAFVLREIRSIAEKALGHEVKRAVVTVPANFNELQRTATKAAGKVAGLDVARILNEPTAAALAYGLGKQTREKVAVFDLGGGTFDITLLELAGDVFEVLATAGDTFLGGDDVDLAILDSMIAIFEKEHGVSLQQNLQAKERMRAAAEWAKIQLSSEQLINLRIEELAMKDGRALNLDFEMTRQDLLKVAKPVIAKAFSVCEEAFRLAETRPTQLDAVVLVGGSTKMPLVRQMVEEYFQKTPRTEINPDLVVAEGAALYGSTLSTSSAPQKTQLGGPSLPKPLGLPRHNMGAPPLPKPMSQNKPPAPLPRPMAQTLSGARPPLPPPVLLQPPQFTNKTIEVSLEEGDFQHQVTQMEAIEEVHMPVMPLQVPKELDGEMAGELAGMQDVPIDLGTGFEIPVPDVSFQQDEVGPAIPLLVDVTPQSLGIETVGGFSEVVIKKNSAIPIEQMRVFTTAVDEQTEVSAKIVQGESRKIVENQALGEIHLSGLRKAPRGVVRVEVTFMIGPDGMLSVKAMDHETKLQQSIKINLIGSVDEQEIEAMQKKQEQNLKKK